MAGQHKAALAVFETVLRKDPDNVAALNDAGSAADEVGDPVQAVEFFERALELDNANASAFFNLIDLLVREEAADLAIEVFRKYQATIPDSREFRKYADIFLGYGTPLPAGSDIDDLSIDVRSSGTEKRHIILVAQPDSGSRTFGQMLRQDNRVVCFDEPFRSELRSFIEAATEDDTPEFGEFLARRELVKRHWSTMQPYEEYYPDFVGHQEAYIQALLGAGEHVYINSVRCSAKIEALRRFAPDALIVHLVRDPRAWVTSQLFPYGKQIPNLGAKFFTYDEPFDVWGRQTAAHAINAQGYAHEQLLQVWNYFVMQAEAAGPDLTIRFEHLSLDPGSVLSALYEQLNLPYRSLELEALDELNPPHAPQDAHWSAALSRHVSDENRRFLFDFNSIPMTA